MMDTEMGCFRQGPFLLEYPCLLLMLGQATKQSSSLCVKCWQLHMSLLPGVVPCVQSWCVSGAAETHLFHCTT